MKVLLNWLKNILKDFEYVGKILLVNNILQYLSLQYCNLNSNAFQAISDSLCKTRNLKILDLSGN